VGKGFIDRLVTERCGTELMGDFVCNRPKESFDKSNLSALRLNIRTYLSFIRGGSVLLARKDADGDALAAMVATMSDRKYETTS
jgi:hypothetical protein